MKVSKITWVLDEIIKQFIHCRQSGRLSSRLFSVVFISVIASGCNFWPEYSKREISISHRISQLPPGIYVDHIDSAHVAQLLEISKKRYIELKNAGAIYCLPGQMLRIRKKMDLVEHEIDGALLLDAHRNMKDLFKNLYNMKNQVESNNPSKACYEFYADSHEGALQTLGVWENSAEINTLLEGK